MAVFGVLQEPICYGIAWGTTGADLLRHCLVYCRRAQRAESFSRPPEMVLPASPALWKGVGSIYMKGSES